MRIFCRAGISEKSLAFSEEGYKISLPDITNLEQGSLLKVRDHSLTVLAISDEANILICTDRALRLYKVLDLREEWRYKSFVVWRMEGQLKPGQQALKGLYLH